VIAEIEAVHDIHAFSPELTVSAGLSKSTVFVDQPLGEDPQTVVLDREQYLKLRGALDEYFGV